MPTYRYRCTSCKHEFDAFQSMKDAALTSCPKCSKAIIRIIQPVGKFTGLGMRELFYLLEIRAYSFPKFSKMGKN